MCERGGVRFYLAAGLCAWAIAHAAPVAAQPAVSRDPFRDVAGLTARLRALHDAHPTTTRLTTVATTAHGDVLALEVDPSGRFAADAPALFIQGGIHGNEWIATEVVLRLAELVTDGRPRWDGLVYRLVPTVNVDGFATGTRKALDGDGKPFDANRDFPVPGQPDAPSRPLIAALRDYVQRGHVVAVLDYHSDAECMLWPYAYDAAAAPTDVDALAAITTAMAGSVGFCSGQVAKIIRYKHQGTAADWYAAALGVPSILVELGPVDGPGRPAVAQILIDQERPFERFLAWLEARGTKPAPPAPPAGCRSDTVTVGEGRLGYRATGQVCDGARDGAWSFAFLDGATLREGRYARGLEQGPWRTYHPDGQPCDVGQYVDGRPDGTWKRYAASGALIEERSWVAGVREGQVSRWAEDGTLAQVRTCTHGICATQCKYDACARLAAAPPPPERHAKRAKATATRAKAKAPARAKAATKPRRR